MSALPWTATSARLPDDDVLVLIAMDDGEVWPAVRDYGRWIFVSGAEVTQAVTHWMHLPAAPDEAATLRLGEICEALGVDVTEALLAEEGFRPIKHERTARLYPASDLPAMRLKVAARALGLRVIEAA